MKTVNFALFTASFLLLGACASDPVQLTQAAPDPSVTLDEINLAIENGVKLQNDKGEEMVCRREPKTGSRLARETICMTNAEWVRVAEESQRNTQKTMKLGNIPRGM
jgi:hypothetical protein